MLVSLPGDVLMKICKYLPFDDLHNLAESDHLLEEIANHPTLWSRYEANSEQILPDIEAFTKDPRFSTINSINISKGKITTIPGEDLNILLKFIRQNKCLKKLRLVNINLCCIPGYPLSSSLLRVPVIVLENCQLTTEQLTCLLRELKYVNPLNTLSLSGNSLEYVPSDLFLDLPDECTSLNLSLTDLNTQQISGLLKSIGYESKLKDLNLSDLNLSAVQPSILNNPAQFLTSLNISNVMMNEEMKNSLFECLSTEKIVLEKLDVSGVSVCEVDAVVLSSAVVKICEVHLANTWLSAGQFTAILNRLSEESVLKKLDACGNSDLCDLTAEDLLVCSLYLESLNLSSCFIHQESISEFIQVQGCEEDSSFKLTLFEGDYTTKQFKKKLSSSKCIDLHSADLPVYADEQSCRYSADKAAEPITLTETIRLER